MAVFSGIRNHFHRKIIMDGLQRQRHLLRNGLSVTADVVEVRPTCVVVKDFVEIRLSLGIHRPEGTIVISESRSVVRKSCMPVPGQRLVIHFFPKDTAYILII